MLIYIASDDEATADKIRRHLAEEGLGCPAANVVSVGSVAEQLSRVKPDLVLMVLDPAIDKSMIVMSGLRVEPPARVLAVGPAADPKLVIRALRSGADDYLDADDLETHLRAALPRCRAANQSQQETGRVIAVLAPGGGSGSSTLAVNLAAVLAQKHERSVLIDMKLEAGDLDALLDLKPEHTLSDLCMNIDRTDLSLFHRTLTPHRSGVHLLAAPRRLSDIPHVSAQSVGQVLRLARSGFPNVIVDLDHSYRDEQSEVLRQADVVLLVLRMDFTVLRNARRTRGHLKALGLDENKVRIIVNRYGQPKEVPSAQAEEALGVQIFHYVPDDPKAVNRSNNNGVPVVIEDPRSKVSLSLSKLAAGIDDCRKSNREQ